MNRTPIPIEAALEIVEDMDLPDGAWWAALESLTGKDSGEIAAWLAKNYGAEETKP